jgi:hypothetical protein
VLNLRLQNGGSIFLRNVGSQSRRLHIAEDIIVFSNNSVHLGITRNGCRSLL